MNATPTRQVPRRGSHCWRADWAAQRLPPLVTSSRNWFPDLFDLVVLLFGVDLIEIMPLAQNILCSEQPSFDGVVSIVVAEGSVAPDDLKVLELIDERLDL